MSDQDSMQSLWDNSYLFGGSSRYLEEMYEAYLADPNSVAENWRDFFSTYKSNGEISHQAVREEFLQLAKNPIRSSVVQESTDVEQVRKQSHVLQLINAYRSHGHHHARLDPLGKTRPKIADLDLAHHGLSQADFDKTFSTNSFSAIKSGSASLKEIYTALNETYCGSIGIEYMHITDHEQTAWLQRQIENNLGRPDYNSEQKKQILKYVIAAEGLEKYLGTKYVGQKRFSLEGGESLIPMLDDLVQRAGEQGVKELVVGMAHRGRLNVLVNVLGKEPKELFEEFEGKFVDDSRSGDVKYHMGFSSDVRTPGGILHLTLGFNPSHLEIISPVIGGSVRARQDRRSDFEHNQVLPVVIHGDAAFAGQGVVMETFNMSQARGYRTGGTVHIVINNQIGFTTSNPLDSRSTLYCSDVAKMVQAPILHVNGDDPEAVVFAGQIALDFRAKFKKDVVIDLVCYRRQGHNEADEPSITQPIMYQKIRSHDTTMELYGKQLIAENVINQQGFEDLKNEYRDDLDKGHAVVDLVKEGVPQDFTVDWAQYMDAKRTDFADTKIELSALKETAKRLQQIPESFQVQAQVAKEYANRAKMANGEIPCNWGFAETLAYATLLDSGYAVRISGQDCCRGTFSHRQAVLHDHNTGEQYTPLDNVSQKQANLTIIDSVLSEEAVLGYEYGYSTAEPGSLVIWEAQFGDFANGAQVVIDQFLSSGYQKWARLCGLVMLLPHGYEGMGPEHSSARLERYMQLCAQYNIQVCVPSTPAQCYHMLRRQMLRLWRRPLVVMTPKSLLRHKLATSTLDDLANGEFKLIIPEIDDLKVENVTRVVLCSGKVYYDLLEKRRKDQREDVAIIRVEQLYPFPEDFLREQLSLYTNAKDVVWCQEEPINQGAWYCTQHHLLACLSENQNLSFAGREAAAAPAAGFLSMHLKQQAKLVADALG